MVNNSPKNASTKSITIPSSSSNMIDAVEDDLVKRYENERLEKERAKANDLDTNDIKKGD